MIEYEWIVETVDSNGDIDEVMPAESLGHAVTLATGPNTRIALTRKEWEDDDLADIQHYYTPAEAPKRFRARWAKLTEQQ